jgi:hypothetical protein
VRERRRKSHGGYNYYYYISTVKKAHDLGEMTQRVSAQAERDSGTRKETETAAIHPW